VGKKLVDPPGVIHPFRDWWYWALVIFLALTTLLLVGVRSTNRNVQLICITLALAGYVGFVSGLADLELKYGPTVFAVTGIVLGIAETLTVRPR
jgi:hypothetical protein